MTGPGAAPLLTRSEFEAAFVPVRTIGSGAMGQVLLARQTSLDRLVAVKRVSPELASAPYMVERFLQEVRILSRLAHPNIVRLYDFGLVEGKPFLVMEYVEGSSLSCCLENRAASDPRDLLALVCQALAGLAYLHSLGIVHRDVKPANILIARDGTARVADFGLAWPVGTDRFTLAGSILGTPAYLAPELLLGGEPSVLSDLYAVGVVLCNVLSGSQPCGVGCDAPEFYRLRASMDPLPLSFMASGVDPDLARVVDDLLRRDPAGRPDSAETVRRSLEALLRKGGQLVGRRTAGEATATVEGPRAQAMEVRGAQLRQGAGGSPGRRGGGRSRAIRRLALAAVAISAVVAAVAAVLVWRPAPLPGPTARATLDPVGLTVERLLDEVRVRFTTVVEARARVTCRARAPASDPLRSVEEERFGTRHEFKVLSLGPWTSYELTIAIEDRTGGSSFEGPRVLESPLEVMRQVCLRISQDRIEEAATRIGEAGHDAAKKSEILAGLVKSTGYDASFAVMAARCSPYLAGEGTPEDGRRTRALMLNRLSLLRRLDRLAALEKLPFRSRVDELLGKGHAADPAPWVPTASVGCALPARTVLYQTGMHTRRHVRPGAGGDGDAGGDSGTSPASGSSVAAGVVRTRFDVPAHARYRHARLVLEVDALAPVAGLRAEVGPFGLALELWGPLEKAPAPVILQHTFDPRFLVSGMNDLALSLELDDPGHRGAGILSLVLESDDAATRRGLRCQVRSCRLEFHE